MMGVLEAYSLSGTAMLAIAISGATKVAVLPKVVAELQEQYPTVPIYLVEDEAKFPLVNFLNRQIREQSLSFAKCAAPILLQWFIKGFVLKPGSPFDARSIIYLSEMLLDEPATGHDLYLAAHTAESCAKCRRIIPQMLCGPVNLDKPGSS
jgi:hypothetical protein